MAPGGNPEERLAWYLRERLRHIKTCYIDIENKVMEDESDLNRAVSKDTIDDDEFSNVYRHINFAVRNTFRYAMLVAVCSFVEEALVQIAKHVVDNYGTHIQVPNRMNRAQAHMDLLTKHAKLDTTPIASECELFEDMVILRNCVVHAWGDVTGDRNPSQVREAVKRLADSGLEGNFDLVEILADNYLHFGEQIIGEAILKAESIINHVLKSMVGHAIVPW